MEIEPVSELADSRSIAEKLSRKLRESLGLKVPVNVVTQGTLPRFEMKARRFVVAP
jgi:phenylacetate-coenzyme A ligase PaaK-like adenylate-forming protein